VKRLPAILLIAAAGTMSALAQQPQPPGAVPAVPDPSQAIDPTVQPPGIFKPDATREGASPDVWIFSGALQGSHEEFSGTLVADKGEAQFELKLGAGATCDGSSFDGEVGLVRLNEITCSDDRPMRALFVPQGGRELKVFGHVGDERFVASAHLLGEDPPPEKKQTAEPTAPALQDRPGGTGTPPSPK
jgi:hypothetical protein